MDGVRLPIRLRDLLLGAIVVALWITSHLEAWWICVPVAPSHELSILQTSGRVRVQLVEEIAPRLRGKRMEPHQLERNSHLGFFPAPSSRRFPNRRIPATTLTGQVSYTVIAMAMLVALGLRRRRGPTECPQCGYDMRSSGGQCPECGFAIGVSAPS
jgi:hypothetical protein